MAKVNYHLHHQAVVSCPKCNELIIEDLGGDDLAEGIEVTCPSCGEEYELDKKEE